MTLLVNVEAISRYLRCIIPLLPSNAKTLVVASLVARSSRQSPDPFIMVSLKDVEASNALIPSTLPPGLVAVFVGATSGIGEHSLKGFAKNTKGLKPRIYFVGRSQTAADRISAELNGLNPEGQYTFIKADVSSMKAVDDVCNQIKAKEQSINLLFVSQGTVSGEGDNCKCNLSPSSKSDRILISTAGKERTDFVMRVVLYSRIRFMQNLLPQLQRGTALRRVISVFAAAREGAIDFDDISFSKGLSFSSMPAFRGHLVSVMALCLEKMAELAPGVTFIHSWPGAVPSNLARGNTVPDYLMWSLFLVFGPFICMRPAECGDRYTYLATSARYPPQNAEKANLIPLAEGVSVIKGNDGQTGSGVYDTNEFGEGAMTKSSEAILASLRAENGVEKVWQHMEERMDRLARS